MREERKKSIRVQAKLLGDEPLAALLNECVDEIELNERRWFIARRCLEEGQGLLGDMVRVLTNHEAMNGKDENNG